MLRFACVGLAVFTGCFFEDVELSDTAAPLIVNDQWLPADTAPPVVLVGEEGAYFSPVHATLLPDGKVMFLGLNYSGTTKAALFTPTPLGQPIPPWMVVDSQPIPLEAQAVQVDGWWVDDTPFCAGQTLLADGSLFIAGGTRGISMGATTYMFGLDYGITYKNGTWARLNDRMKTSGPYGEPIRWYPSTTRLADGKVMVTGGRDYVAKLVNGTFVEIGTENVSVDMFDPATSTFSTASALGATPASIFNGDYSHVFQLPYAWPQDVLVFGHPGRPVRFGAATSSWVESNALRPGTATNESGQPIEATNDGASTAMLPIRWFNGDRGYGNGATLVVGGAHDRPHESAVDIYDPYFDAWHPRQDMGIRRHHPSTVLLPDGHIAIIAGHDDTLDNTDPLSRKTQLVDTTQPGFPIHTGSSTMGEARGYHTISLLLPDGRVLVGGGRTAGPDAPTDEKPTLRYYHPPYLSRLRPTLSYAPPVVEYSTGFWVTHDQPISEAVLIALGSMTHSIDMNQRAVQLPIYQQFSGASILVGPLDARAAPPGHYMLFVLDANRTPSIARIVEVR